MASGVDRPIFIIGVGRSGSTAFHQVLSAHPAVAWLSRLSDLCPSRPSWTRCQMRVLDVPILGSVFQRIYEPSEAYRFWDYHCRGFSVPCRDLRADDVTERVRVHLPRVLAGVTTSRRRRILIKITGWPRVRFLYELFPDARFIHVLRDGRAVVNSLINVDWWFGWAGPQRWVWGDLSPAQQAEWERHCRSFVALAAIQWKLLMDAMEEATRGLSPRQLLTIRYEDLCADPEGAFRQAVAFCELDYPPVFGAAVRRARLRSENDKWRQDLTADQQRVLHEVLGEYLARYGYA
ncbi:MAG TPA: sulfotransferase [Gemmatimonadaceae bacterium]|nr:sulfotransferase [Gemmatimonadaceae bacterium]